MLLTVPMTEAQRKRYRLAHRLSSLSWLHSGMAAHYRAICNEIVLAARQALP